MDIVNCECFGINCFYQILRLSIDISNHTLAKHYRIVLGRHTIDCNIDKQQVYQSE